MKPHVARYVGIAGDSLAYIWSQIRDSDAEPLPIGKKDEYPKAKMAAGLSMTTLALLGGAAYFLMKK